MAEDWKIEKRHGECAACGRAFAPGDTVHAAIFDAASVEEAPAPDAAAGAVFLRRDYCEACWPEAPSDEALGRWRAAVPEPKSKDEPVHRRIDIYAARDFFRRLEGSSERARVNFRYILALILVRKKALRFTDVVRAESREYLLLEEPGENIRHKVLDPGLGEEELLVARRELGPLLGLSDEETAADAPDTADAPGESPGIESPDADGTE